MIIINDYSNWDVYDGISEGSGRSEKEWLVSNTGTVGLFKYPKSDMTSEHVSEHLAHRLGNVLGIKTAMVEIGYRNGRIGSMSYRINSDSEQLIEGVSFICGKYPSYNADKMHDIDTNLYYCLNMIINSTDSIIPKTDWSEMLLFDFLIGNSDRHHSNWAIVKSKPLSQEDDIMQRSPLYDNGSSLCSYVSDTKASQILNNPPSFVSQTDSKSKSRIRIDGKKKSLPTHKCVITHLLNNNENARSIATQISERLNSSIIHALLEDYPTTVLSSSKKDLIEAFLDRKIAILNEVITITGD